MSSSGFTLLVPADVNPNGLEVRFVGTKEVPEWIAADLCAAAEVENVSRALADFDDDEKGIHFAYTLGGTQRLLTVYEPGLYRLLTKSRTPAAKRFKRWVFHEVLPTIRKHGCYPAPAAQPHVSSLEPYKRRVMMLGCVRRAIPTGYWSVFVEGSDLLVLAEQIFGAAALEMTALDLLDGSVGTHWANHRNGQSWAGSRLAYDYTFPEGDPRGTVRAWCYPMAELARFREWLHGRYVAEHLPDYMRRKFGTDSVQRALPAFRAVGVPIVSRAAGLVPKPEGKSGRRQAEERLRAQPRSATARRRAGLKGANSHL